MKHLRYIYLIMLAAMTALSATSQEVKTVRGDRVWEYYRYYNGRSSNETFSESIRLCFKGTEEVNGVTYHTLVFDGGLREDCEMEFKYIGDEEDDNFIWIPHYSVSTIEKCPDWLPCLMREDNGKVFRLVPNPYNGDEAEEIEVFDFNLKAGDIYSGYFGREATGFPANLNFKKIPLFEIVGSNTQSIESNHTTNKQEGDDYRVLDLRNMDTSYYPIYCTETIKLIEGIGLVDMDFVSSTGTIALMGSNIVITDGETYRTEYTLNNVYDLDGNVIFAGKNWSPGAAVDTMPADNMGLTYSGNKLTASAFGGKVTLTIADLSGRMVLRDEGRGEVSLDASQLQPGVYVATANTAGRSRTIKIMRK